MAAIPSMKAKYHDSVTGALTEHFSYANVNMVPTVEKIVVNMGLGEAIQNPKLIEAGVVQMTAIAGQKPIIQRARRSVATLPSTSCS